MLGCGVTCAFFATNRYAAFGHDGDIMRQFSSAILAARGNGNTSEFVFLASA